jgi:membrane protein
MPMARIPPPKTRVAAGRAWWSRSLGGRGLHRIRELDLDTHALALAAQQVLCTAPLVVAISAVTQRLQHRNISVYLARFFGLHGASAQDVENLFGRSADSISTTTLVLGLLTALVFTTGVANVQQRAFEMIWTLPRISGVRSYIRQVLWAPALAAFCVAILYASRLGRMIDERIGIGPWAATLLQGLMTLIFYWWTQHWLLRGRVRWLSLLPGAIMVSLLLIATVQISRAIMPAQISWQVHAYGEIGAVFMLSIWLVAASIIVFAGVLIGALIAERHSDPDRHRVPTPGSPPLTEQGLESAAAAVENLEGADADLNDVHQHDAKRPLIRR